MDILSCIINHFYTGVEITLTVQVFHKSSQTMEMLRSKALSLKAMTCNAGKLS